MVALLAVGILSANVQTSSIRVKDARAFREAVSKATPGTTILLEPGEFPGGFHFSNLNGLPGKPIVITSADPSRPARIVGGGSGLQLSSVSHLEVRSLVVDKATGNGINIDDGGEIGKPSHHIVLRNLVVMDLPKGNRDAIKLSGVDDFLVADCKVERWGGSGIDMVGCHRGTISNCKFLSGGDNGVQTKGGSSNIRVVSSQFLNAGQRGINVGGSTGMTFFRPPIDKMPTGRRYEAKDISVFGCTFTGSTAPIAFVGVVGADVSFNTIYRPERWALRILQETIAPEFAKCQKGMFTNNLIVFRSSHWASGGVNVGANTLPESFRFATNFWYCEDRPEASRPTLPTPESGGIYGRNPEFADTSQLIFKVSATSPARNFGAHAFRE